jgi:hypothetical protein
MTWEMKDLWTPQRGLGSHDYGFAETVDASPMLWIIAHYFLCRGQQISCVEPQQRMNER